MTVDAGRGDDDALVLRVARGDRIALAALYDRYAPVLLAIGVRMLRDRAEAEDVVHDVFLEAWRSAGDFDPARGTVRAWLCMRMRSRVLDRQKSPRVARAEQLDEEQVARRPAPELDPVHRLERERVRHAVEALSAEQRELVELAYFAGLSMQQIAERLRCPAGTVKSRLSTTRERLRAALSEDTGGDPAHGARPAAVRTPRRPQ